ncbi:MAG TPA: hypothetical protein ENH82_10600 [bacterium]|nr:hypothetical protein [bacterium]
MKATHKLIRINPNDAHYHIRQRLQGKRGFFYETREWDDLSKAGTFIFEGSTNDRIFYSVIVKELC